MAAGNARRPPAGRIATIGVLVVAGVLLPLRPAPAATRPDTRTGASTTTPRSPTQVARAQAARLAAEVDTLTRNYQVRAARAHQALATYAASFAAGEAAGLARDRSVLELDTALAARSRTVRAVYASGGTLTLSGSVLGARSVQDAIWRLETSRRLLTDLLDRRGTELLIAQRAVTVANVLDRRAAATKQALAVDLATVQIDRDRADQALSSARSRLAGLDHRVARLEALQRAAARLAAAEAADRAAGTAMPAPGATDIPSSFAAAYRAAAATCAGLRWSLLAAVGQVESGHGRNNGPSSAGAIGPMQFMPATFAGYAVDGDQDGRTDPWDPQDAIFTAARYLCRAGASAGAGPDGVQRALFAYNHAQWYVDLVLGAERSIRARFGG